MKKCKVCNSTSSTKWYLGPECRNCYKKRTYIPKEKRIVQKECANCKASFKDTTFGQNRKYCNKSCSEKKRYTPKIPIIKECLSCESKFKTVKGYQKYCSKKCYDKEYKSKKSITLKDKLKHNLRNRLCVAIKKGYKSGSAVKDLGCSIEELKKHLESKFQPGMTWDNWSRVGWHIDHIKPLASFNLSNPEEFKKACHYTNLQPLWAKDNLSKGSRYAIKRR